jgi:hypothetical protein
MRPRPENEVVACEPGHFGQMETRLHRHQAKGVIAPTKLGASIGRREQCLDLRTGESGLGSA